MNGLKIGLLAVLLLSLTYWLTTTTTRSHLKSSGSATRAIEGTMRTPRLERTLRMSNETTRGLDWQLELVERGPDYLFRVKGYGDVGFVLEEILNRFSAHDKLRDESAALREGYEWLKATSQAEEAKLREALELAWGLIANASGGDWHRETVEWRAAAYRWRDKHYHPSLTHYHPSLTPADVHSEKKK